MASCQEGLGWGSLFGLVKEHRLMVPQVVATIDPLSRRVEASRCHLRINIYLLDFEFGSGWVVIG